MRHESRAMFFHRTTRNVAERARARRMTTEGQRLRVYDAARDHLAEPGAEQATTVARRTAATWR